MLIIFSISNFLQIPLASKHQMDALRSSHHGDHSSHYCSCGIRQDLSKVMDEIACLRAKMKEQRERHELEMIEIKVKLNLKQTVSIDEANLAACNNRCDPMGSKVDDKRSR